MKKRIRVIKINGKYVDRHQYSQGQSSYSTTPDILKAIDLNSYEFNSELLWKCLSREGGVIEEYDVTIEPVPVDELCTLCEQPASVHGVFYGHPICPMGEPKGIIRG